MSLRQKYPSEYQTWKGMKERVGNKNSKCYNRYGGRGITICQRWIDSFDNFISDVGIKPSVDYELDRINNNGNYNKENCRWVSHKANGQNASNSKRWYINGVMFKSLSDASKNTGMSKGAVKYACDGAFVDGKYYKPKENCWSEHVY